MELFHEFFFSKIHKKTPVPESLFNKVIGCYPETSLKERRTPIQVFSDEFGEIFKTPVLWKTSRWLLLFYEKIFNHSKNSLRKEKMEAACKKNKDTQNKNIATIYIKSSYPFITKKFFISFFSASYDILKTRLETMQSHWGFVYYRRLFLTFGLKKIVFIYTTVTITFTD